MKKSCKLIILILFLISLFFMHNKLVNNYSYSEINFKENSTNKNIEYDSIQLAAIPSSHTISIKVQKVFLDDTKNLKYYLGESTTITVPCNGNHTTGNNHNLSLNYFHPSKLGWSENNWIGWQKGSYYTHQSESYYNGTYSRFYTWTTSNFATNSSSSGSMPYNAYDTFYLVYKTNNYNYTISYNANGGSGAPPTQTATSSASSYNFTISSTRPTKDGYTFLGWADTSNAQIPSYYSGGNITLSSASPSKTLHAVWEKNPEKEKVTLTYMDRGLQYGNVESYDKESTATIKDCTNTRQDYTFKGWTTNKDALVADWKPEERMRMVSNTTLYAVWEKKSIDNGNGITIEKTRTAINGDSTKYTAEPGDEISWDIVVTNNSNVSKTITLTEKLTGASLTKSTITLGPGKSETIIAKYTVKSSDKGKTIYNIVSATTGSSGEKENPEATDEGTLIPDEYNNIMYTIEWYDATTKEKIKVPEQRTGTLGNIVSVTETDRLIEGYTFDEKNEENVLTAKLDGSSIVLKLYFTKNADSTEESENPDKPENPENPSDPDNKSENITNEKNPITKDNILITIATFTISFISFVLLLIKKKKILNKVI